MTIEQIYDKYYSQVFNAVRQMVKDEHYSEDVTSMVFVKVNRLLPTFDESKSAFTTWLYTITKSVVLDFFRTIGARNDRMKDVSDFVSADGNQVFDFNSHSRADDVVNQREKQAEIAKAFRSLKPKYRKVAVLFFLRENSHAEIAKAMQIPVGSVKGMINRCRAMLQEQLQNVHA
jgi:RNA polymerase sigma-70 factor (ECF subfamily)